MKIKVYTHKLKIQFDDDFPKVVKYFADHKVDVEFLPAVETNIALRDTPTQLYLPSDNKKDVQYLMYMFDRFQDNRANSFALNFSYTLQCMEIATSTFDDAVFYTWKTIAHEIMHTFFHRLHNMGIQIYDPMDSTLVNGVYVPYYKNDDPYAIDGNFAVAWKALQPHWNKLFPTAPTESTLYKPKNFALSELVPQVTITRFGDKAWEFLDERMLRNLQYIREALGRTITVNTPSLQYRCFDPVTYRKDGYSQHNHGRSVDFDVKGMTAQQVRDWLKVHYKELPEPNIWVEEGTRWVHFDIRASDKKGAYFFYP